MPAFSTCTSCGYNAEGAIDACPRCGAPTRVTRESRTRGVILVICGLILVGMMGTVTYYLAPTMIGGGKDPAGSSFQGTDAQARMILGLFAVIFVFGLTSLLYGLYQIVFRRESKVFMAVGLALAIVLVAMVVFTMRSLK